MEKKWGCIFEDTNNRRFELNLTYKEDLGFDTIYVAFTNKDNQLPFHLLVKLSKTGREIPLDEVLMDGENDVYVYGLNKVTVRSAICHEIVCHGKSTVSISNGKNMEKQDIELRKRPVSLLHIEHKATFDVAVKRLLPPRYIVTCDHVHPEPVEFLIFIQLNGDLFICNIQCTTLNYELPFEFPSAAKVECHVFQITKNEILKTEEYYLSRSVSCSRLVEFKTYLSCYDVHTLFYKALQYGARLGTPKLRPITFLYRNKPESYYNHIRFQKNGYMQPYLKNNGGEQGSVLNGRLKGLFFSTLVDYNTNLPHPFSYFGNVRLYVEATLLFNPNVNLYFSDFYCHTKRHKVTLVLTPKVSPANHICQEYLYQLDLYRNPYFRIILYADGSCAVMANIDIIVEVFYTETINIPFVLYSCLGYMERTPIKGRGYVSPSGIPKNPSCSICNLNHR